MISYLNKDNKLEFIDFLKNHPLFIDPKPLKSKSHLPTCGVSEEISKLSPTGDKIHCCNHIHEIHLIIEYASKSSIPDADVINIELRYLTRGLLYRSGVWHILDIKNLLDKLQNIVDSYKQIKKFKFLNKSEIRDIKLEELCI